MSGTVRKCSLNKDMLGNLKELHFHGQRVTPLRHNTLRVHSTNKYAQTCLDLIGHENPTTTQEKPGWKRYSFLPNKWMDDRICKDNNLSWKRAYQGTHIQMLYHTFYNQTIIPTALDRETQKSLIHSFDKFSNAVDGAPFTEISIPGVWFQFVFEVGRYKGSKRHKEGMISHMRLNRPENVVLVAIWVQMKQTVDLKYTDTVFVPRLGHWCGMLEFNPMDSHLAPVYCLVPSDLDGNMRKTTHSVLRSGKTSFCKQTNRLDFEREHLWELYALDVLSALRRIAVKSIQIDIENGLTNKHLKYIFLLICVMNAMGDSEEGDLLALLYKEGGFPPHCETVFLPAHVFISSDSLFRLKRVGKKKSKPTFAKTWIEKELTDKTNGMNSIQEGCLHIKCTSGATSVQIVESLLNDPLNIDHKKKNKKHHLTQCPKPC